MIGLNMERCILFDRIVQLLCASCGCGDIDLVANEGGNDKQIPLTTDN